MRPTGYLCTQLMHRMGRISYVTPNKKKGDDQDCGESLFHKALKEYQALRALNTIKASLLKQLLKL